MADARRTAMNLAHGFVWLIGDALRHGGALDTVADDLVRANGSSPTGAGDAPADQPNGGGLYVHGPSLVLLVLLPFFGRFVFDYVLGSLRQRCGIEVGPEFRTCIDRPFVQLEIRAAVEAEKNVITVFEEERRRPAFFDYGLAWTKYGESEFKFLLDIDSVTYRRDTEEAQAMLRRILAKAQRADEVAPAERPINGEHAPPPHAAGHFESAACCTAPYLTAACLACACRDRTQSRATGTFS